MIRQAINFLKDDIWRISTRKLPPRRSMLINQARTFLLALRGFAEDQCQLRASALTFYTLLSIVPVVAMAFGIAKGFGLEKVLEQQLKDRFEGHEEVLQRVLEFSHSLLENTRGGVVAGIGVLILFWTVLKLLDNIEASFNGIWGVQAGRSIGRKFSDYLAMILVCPLILALAGSATVFVSTNLHRLTTQFEFYGIIGATIHIAGRAIPLAMIWLLFTFLYMFLPNTRVRFRAALPAGIVAGILYQLAQWFYIFSQVGLSKYNTIYGSFAALPFFLVWVQFSWLIVLFGAELAFAAQNVDTYEFEPDSQRASAGLRFRLSLLIIARMVRDFDCGAPPATIRDLNQELEIPVRLLRRIIFDCTCAGLLREVKGATDRETAYLPATAPDKYSVAFVAHSLLKHGCEDLPVAPCPELDHLTVKLQELSTQLSQSPANLMLKDLA